jgi:hypothetical protein
MATATIPTSKARLDTPSSSRPSSATGPSSPVHNLPRPETKITMGRPSNNRQLLTPLTFKPKLPAGFEARSATVAIGNSSPLLGDARGSTNPQPQEKNNNSSVSTTTINTITSSHTIVSPGTPETLYRTDPMEPASGKIYGEMIETKRTEEMCIMLGMTYGDVWKMRKIFNDIDVDNTNTITEAEFFYLINENIRPLTRAIFRLTPELPPKPKRVNFDQMLFCLCTFSSFTAKELLKFVFDIYASIFLIADAPNVFSSKVFITRVGSEEILHMGKELEQMQIGFRQTIDYGVQRVIDPGSFYLQNGYMNFQEFHELSKRHSVLFYPIIRMQQNIRLSTKLGKNYWPKKVSEKIKVQNLVRYMEGHLGSLPPLNLWEKIVDNFFLYTGLSMHRKTSQLLRERAINIYKMNK